MRIIAQSAPGRVAGSAQLATTPMHNAGLQFSREQQ
jgi:hypothetical protein